MSAWAVIPVKSFAQAKSRLESTLSSEHRRDLASRLFGHVIREVEACPRIAGILVLTNGDDVASIARHHGADVLRDAPDVPPEDQRPGHLGRVVDVGMAHLALRGIRSAVVLMADLPRLSRHDVVCLLERLLEYPIVVAPDRYQQGTNALAVSPPDRMRTCFGHPDSMARHLARADEHGFAASIYQSPSLALDIDVPADVVDAAQKNQ